MPRSTFSGIGYDVHAFAEGRPLFLGGIEIPHAKGLDGHSDADVLIHAIADALLGTVASADIGHHFPNTDPSIKGIASTDILSRVVDILDGQGARIINIDATLIAEAPKIAPHLTQIRARLAECVRLPVTRISVKATTNEKMGFLGRGEGIAAMAIASVEREEDDVERDTAPPVPPPGL